ncbi:MAG TPA: tRNA (N(6)-L-threonylcarbamoyladenosine(37)-C(2))-methylthiotransferase MtaB [Ferruginibacter sp.]|nr:tRNA (N(6)-L-threonylcarbamoyladenosine(37)-C(2))-methylthiotransferase MtaB [Ferruginibacter sp.]HRE64675.1 tRNA (N(6)-L-threonylcarbamoyladenosine(37)-C(2))-methylthiotransferase MtaB [Ferruginibacter sp.]
MNRTVALHTLGCKLNFSETTAIGRMLENDGFVKKDFDDVADVYVINTCSVTDNADKECRQLVRRIQRKAPEAMVVITGCYAQLKPKEIAEIPGVNLVLGAAEKFNIAAHLKDISNNDATKICSCDIEDVNTFTASHSINERTRVFLKVQDGCDYNCSFCTIPQARGMSRSDSIENIKDNVKNIAAGGAKEIVLTGINLGDFGKGLHGGKKREEDFFSLIKELDELEGVDRYRISSIEPNLLSNDMIEFVSNSKRFMPHFHIPLQSGSNEVLGAMRRRYKRELYAEKVSLIKTLMPHACIGVDVIVGFPGETDELFNETAQFLQVMDISYLHVFTYSERDNTHALSIKPVVPMNIRHQRNKILRNISYTKMQMFTEQHIGNTRKTLFESTNKNGMMEGYTDNYIKITAPYKAEWENRVIDWTV